MDGKSSDIRQEQIEKLKLKSFICLDRLFAGNDQLKTNIVLQLKDANITFKVT